MQASSSTGNRWIATLALAVTAGLTGCATPPPGPKTTVVLLPDEEGTVGAVSVSGAAGSQTLDRAFSFAAVDASRRSAPTVGSRTLARDSVSAAYRELFEAQPTKPRTFILYFRLDRTELIPESKALLPEVLATARARKPTEITVFGHADASGPSERNWKLSAERAQLIADLLRASDPAVGNIDVQYFGHKAPLVPSPPRAAEPKNRRAEILIL